MCPFSFQKKRLRNSFVYKKDRDPWVPTDPYHTHNGVDGKIHHRGTRFETTTERTTPIALQRWWLGSVCVEVLSHFRSEVSDNSGSLPFGSLYRGDELPSQYTSYKRTEVSIGTSIIRPKVTFPSDAQWLSFVREATSVTMWELSFLSFIRILDGRHFFRY